jgi:Family of unknown function (DUF5681)
MSQPPRDPEVGYCRPPKSGQFKKGQSGNPRGRPRHSGRFTDRMLEALNEKVTINENGCKRKITKWDALAKQIANKAASGDIRSIKLVVDIVGGIVEAEPIKSEGNPEHLLSAREILQKRIQDIVERMGTDSVDPKK